MVHFILQTEDKYMTLDITKGDVWKVLRKNMSPTFSSGKLKAMMEPMERVAKQLKSHLDEQILNGNGSDLDMKKVFICKLIKHTLQLYTLHYKAFFFISTLFGDHQPVCLWHQQ